MNDALFRVALPTGPCLARGTIEAGPRELAPGDNVRIEMGALGVLENSVVLTA